MKKYLYQILFFVLALLLLSVREQSLANKDDLEKITQRQIQNLQAFTKLYGYIRFFHPSDEASKIDWDRFAIYGVEKVKDIKDDVEFKNILKELFLPIAPTVQIYSESEEPKEKFILNDTTGLKMVAWQHYGVGMAEGSDIYKSMRVYSDSKVMDENQLKFSSFATNKLDQKLIQSNKLFAKYPKKEELVKAELGESLFCIIPLTLYCNNTGTLGKDKNYPFQSLFDKVDAIDLKRQTANDKFVQLADVIIAWNVFQHFYPYYDVVNVDWEKVLTETLNEVLQNKTAYGFYDILRKMIAKLQDGHGFVTWKYKGTNGGLLVRANCIEGQIVITSTEDTLFKKGDIIKNINEKSAKNVLKEIEMFEPGSRQLKKYLGLIAVDFGYPGSIIKLELVRDGQLIAIEKKREIKEKDFFRRHLLEFDYPAIKRIDDGIYYLNLLTIDEKGFTDSLYQLAQANGIIFDFRWTGKRKENYKPFNQMILLMHLIDSQVESAKWNVPSVIYPDRKNFTFYESSWSLQPTLPHFKSKNVFITDPNVISSMETFLAIVEHYKLGEIVGGVTAGTNGNVNFIPLPGGFEIMFTGMKVLKHDGSQHHLIGVKPTYPVQRTIKAVKEGRDEYLEKAIEVIKKSIK